MGEGIKWRAIATLRKFGEEWKIEDIESGLAVPYEVIHTDNVLQYGGGSAMWECLMGRWGDLFWNSNAALGVGDGGGGQDRSLNDLTGGSKFRKAQDGGYPHHTDGFTEDALHTFWRSTYTGGQANFHWREWGLFNSTSGGRLLNRKVEDFGVKRPGSTWQFSVELILDS